MTYHHMPASKGLLIIAIKPRNKENICMTFIYYTHILQGERRAYMVNRCLCYTWPFPKDFAVDFLHKVRNVGCVQVTIRPSLPQWLQPLSS
jgi:hypothetical protein